MFKIEVGGVERKEGGGCMNLPEGVSLRNVSDAIIYTTATACAIWMGLVLVLRLASYYRGSWRKRWYSRPLRPRSFGDGPPHTEYEPSSDGRPYTTRPGCEPEE